MVNPRAPPPSRVSARRPSCRTRRLPWLLEGEDPGRDGGRVVGERPELRLPGSGVECAALDAAGVDVQTDQSRIIRHENPSRACGNRAGRLPGRHGHYRPRPTRSPGRARRAAGALYVLLISSVVAARMFGSDPLRVLVN